uniref:Uncharacterized protein LOC102802478 n=1 Tax=Saccoglossus kowalevskii TaxID=10224 RepID=A0ABM0MEQ0_SACKO
YCPTPDFPTHVGVADYSVTFPVENGTVIELKCNPARYEMIGDPLTLCINMTWTTMPNCTATTEFTSLERTADFTSLELTTDLMSSTLPPSTEITSMGTTTDIISPHTSTSVTPHKSTTDAATSFQTTAEPSQCSNPGHPPNGKLINTTNISFPAIPGTEVSYECCDGFEAASDTLICVEDNGGAFWKPAYPVCIPVCNDDELSVGGSCYLLGTGRGSWYEADAYCKSVDVSYYLAEIETAEEHSYLQGNLTLLPQSRWRFWLAMIQYNVGNWTWISGELLTFDIWEDGYPSGQYHCGALVRGGENKKEHFRMRDVECDSTRYILCERGGRITCADPGNLANGKISPDIEYPAAYQQILSFTCDDGYELMGASTIFCNIDECEPGYKWSDSIPECVPKDYCPTPDFPTHVGVADYSLTFPVENGTVIELKCNPARYEMIGDPLTLCINMTWTTMPNCTATTDFTSLEPTTDFTSLELTTDLMSSTLPPSTEITSMGTTTDIISPHTSTSVTPHKSTTDAATSFQTTAEPSQCSNPGHPPNGKLINTTNISFPAIPGTEVSYECCDGFEAASDTLICVEDNGGAFWKPAYPVCIP